MVRLRGRDGKPYRSAAPHVTLAAAMGEQQRLSWVSPHHIVQRDTLCRVQCLPQCAMTKGIMEDACGPCGEDGRHWMSASRVLLHLEAFSSCLSRFLSLIFSNLSF